MPFRQKINLISLDFAHIFNNIKLSFKVLRDVLHFSTSITKTSRSSGQTSKKISIKVTYTVGYMQKRKKFTSTTDAPPVDRNKRCRE